MTWEQKMQACQALGDISLHMRCPGDWYVFHEYVDLYDGHTLNGGCVIGAATPEMAVEKHWEWLTNLRADQWIVVRATRKDRRAVRWNGFMWQDVEERAQ